MKRLISLILFLVVLVSACTPTPTEQPTATIPLSTATLPEPQINTTRPPDVKKIAQDYLNLWADEDYEGMYAMLSHLSQDAFPKEGFIKRYQDTTNALTLIELTSEVTSALTNPRDSQVGYTVSFETALVGTISRNMVMNLTMEDDTWKVQWEEGMIMPELKGGNYLSMDISAPARGNIYDQDGDALVAQSEIVALGITPGGIGDEQHGALVSYLSELTGLNSDYIRSLYQYAGDDWYIPIGETARSNVDRLYNTLSTIGGLDMNYYTSRYYFGGGVAAHITGYVQSIFPEELAEYKRMGYRGDEKVGRTGLEAWGEEVLTGKKGASLYVIRPDGSVETRIGYSDSQLSQSIYTTIDDNFQAEVELAINGFKGAIVVLERDTGRVLAMASSPTFDPNLFDPNNYNSGWMLSSMLDPTENKLLNRAAQSAYPLGSVFKIITMAAALETDTFKADDHYFCGSTYTDLAGITLYDWTYEKELPPSGDLTLSEGLMRSCNPWFYHIGLTMYQRGLTNSIAEMARKFGLGSATGIGQVQEVAGSIPDTLSEGDSVQLAIGQGGMLATPLQVATFIAAVGNGGTLYQPQLVEKIAPADGDPTFEFERIVTGTLPVSEENLITIQNAMRSVVANPRGTARNAMLGLQIPIFGKTGTAQIPPLKPHAWFAGYTNLGNSDRPDIAVVVLAENAGEGSEIAAPIFRRVIELYYYGRPSRIYPWESSLYVTRTPTSQFPDTPVPEQSQEETPEP